MVTILIIDDNELIRELLRDVFVNAGYEVVEAENGMNAVELFREHNAALAIVDIIMPEKEGVETLFDLRRAFPDAGLIAISGGGNLDPEDYLKTAREIGVLRTFSKPFDIQEMLETVYKLMAGSQA